MSPTRILAAMLLLSAGMLAYTPPCGAVTTNGRLQIIHLDVGQGDGCVIITPGGQVAMFDDGISGNPTTASGLKVTQQLQALGVTHVDYHFASHYHADHIGSFGQIFGSGGVATVDVGFDRGSSYTTATYTTYVNTLGTKRRTITKGQVITLDSLSAHPVTIKCVNLAGCGLSTTDENSLCVALRLSYGAFDESFDGDLQGSTGGGGVDCESVVATQEDTVEVYKVHHHGSRYSTNDTWLSAMRPKIAVISCGTGNSYGHPTIDALTRLHNHGIHTYWTETGAGATPDANWDKVSNNQVVISATWEPGGVDTVRYAGGTSFDTFTNSGTLATDSQAPVASVTAPVGGETWKAGSSHAITWTATDNVGVTTVDLAYSTDGGVTYPNTIATGLANSGTYAWTVPFSLGSTVKVRVSAHDAAANTGTGASAAAFTIDAWTIASSAGTGGVIVPAGVVSVGQGWNSHFSIAPAANYKLGTLTVDGGAATPDTTYSFGSVVANHTIAAAFLEAIAPVVGITAPVGGESWAASSVQNVTWSASDNVGVDSVNVDVSLTGAAGPWLAVAHGLANTGNYAWTLPAQTSDSALVRITAGDAAKNYASSTSPAFFHITTGSAGVDAGHPVLALARPQPNPAAGSTAIRFSLPAPGRAHVEILDLAGRRLWDRAVDGAAGTTTWVWDGADAGGAHVGAGLYLVRLTTPFGSRTQRLVWLR